MGNRNSTTALPSENGINDDDDNTTTLVNESGVFLTNDLNGMYLVADCLFFYINQFFVHDSIIYLSLSISPSLLFTIFIFYNCLIYLLTIIIIIIF